MCSRSSHETGRKAMEQAREGVYSGVNFARLMVTSAEFRDELVEALVSRAFGS